MNYIALNTITQAVKEQLQPLFSEVKIAAISGYNNLFEALPSLSTFPAAIIAIGNVDHLEQGVIREIEIHIIIIDEFRLSLTDVNSTFELLDSVSSKLTPEVPGGILKLGGAVIIAQYMEVLELDSQHNGYHFTLKATTSFI